MSDSKKFYWLKLKKDFFKRHDIRIIEAMPNGKDYILFYLKLLLESLDHEGMLRFSATIPYNEDMLSTITNTNIDIVRSAMKIFLELHMMEVFDDMTIHMLEVQKLLGCETKAAERVRKHRNNLKALQCNTTVTNRNTEIEIEKELEKELELELDITQTPSNPPKKSKANSKPNTPTELKIKFAEFVAMTNDEYQSLIANEHLNCEAAVKRCIEILDNYKGSKGQKYKSDYRAILSWVIDRYLNEQRSKSKPHTGGMSIAERMARGEQVD